MLRSNHKRQQYLISSGDPVPLIQLIASFQQAFSPIFIQNLYTKDDLVSFTSFSCPWPFCIVHKFPLKMLPTCWSKNFERILYDTSFEWKWHKRLGLSKKVHDICCSYRSFVIYFCMTSSQKSMGARNRVGMGLSYRPARLHRADGIDFLESILWLLKSLKIRALKAEDDWA